MEHLFCPERNCLAKRHLRKEQHYTVNYGLFVYDIFPIKSYPNYPKVESYAILLFSISFAESPVPYCYLRPLFQRVLCRIAIFNLFFKESYTTFGLFFREPYAIFLFSISFSESPMPYCYFRSLFQRVLMPYCDLRSVFQKVLYHRTQ